jgi:hypothetical protein
MATQTMAHCGCGECTGEYCEWTGPLTEMVVVEYTPECWRESHTAARNSGSWPHNGSERVAVERSCAELLVKADPEWVSVVEGADPADYLE